MGETAEKLTPEQLVKFQKMLDDYNIIPKIDAVTWKEYQDSQAAKRANAAFMAKSWDEWDDEEMGLYVTRTTTGTGPEDVEPWGTEVPIPLSILIDDDMRKRIAPWINDKKEVEQEAKRREVEDLLAGVSPEDMEKLRRAIMEKMNEKEEVVEDAPSPVPRVILPGDE